MIDEDRTLQLYGYTSDELSPKSHKCVVAVCEECGKYRVVKKQGYRDLCYDCALYTKERINKISKASKGRYPSEQTRKKISNALKGNTNLLGHVHTNESKSKISSSLKGRFGGEKAPNWKGGVTPTRTRMWHSTSYKNWRAAVFERDDYTCQMCNERGGRIEAHHIRPVRDHKNTLLVFDINNGITLCKRCHLKVNGCEDDYAEEFDRKVLIR